MSKEAPSFNGLLALLLYGLTACAVAAEPVVTVLRGILLDDQGKPLANAPVGIQAPGMLQLMRQRYPQHRELPCPTGTGDH